MKKKEKTALNSTEASIDLEKCKGKKIERNIERKKIK